MAPRAFHVYLSEGKARVANPPNVSRIYMILECYPLLKRIEPQPQLFVGEVSLRRIQLFLYGYFEALLDYNHIPRSSAFDSFHDWVAIKLGYSDSGGGWHNMIVAHCMGFDPKDVEWGWGAFLESTPTKEQHLESIEKFYRLVELYKTEVGSK